jgi:hypothetical protein
MAGAEGVSEPPDTVDPKAAMPTAVAATKRLAAEGRATRAAHAARRGFCWPFMTRAPPR